jgi:hypothetical protein
LPNTTVDCGIRMTKLNASPDRNTFQAIKYLERKAEEGKTPDNDEEVAAMMDYYKSESELKKEREQDPKWQENNMEYDLRSAKWICDKAKASESYAQNLYAAMCNNEFQKLAVMPILKNLKWTCSWRYAGGIVADMREQGDYIDWYCSGIKGGIDLGGGIEEDPHPTWVNESVITDEIRRDLQLLGWVQANDD